MMNMIVDTRKRCSPAPTMYRRHRCDQHCAGGDVLRQLRERVERRRGDVDRLLYGRVDHLRDEHESDREQQSDQLESRHADPDRSYEHADRRQEMDSHVAMDAEHVDDPLDRVVEAVDQGESAPATHRA
jgi:hypothetical protein